jgi:hypothetical protein
LRPENQKNIFKKYRSDLNKLGKIVIESNNDNIEISKEDAQFAYNLYNSFSNLENIK